MNWRHWLALTGWLAFAAILYFVAYAHAADFDYRDKRGVRHWNHYSKHVAKTHHRRFRHKYHKPSIIIVKDRVKFEPLSEPPLQWPLKGPMPWGNISKCCRQFDWQTD